MPWKKYYGLGRLSQLPNDGRELIGKRVYFTVKRDGQNVCVYRNPSGRTFIGSHHRKVASKTIRDNVRSTKEWPKVMELMDEMPNKMIYFEHIMSGKSPTKIERPKKYNSLVMLDIWCPEQEKYLPYNFVHQMAYHHKIPMVELLDEFVVESIDHLYEKRDEWLVWCKKHFREGTVIKDYATQIWAKEKIDLPKQSNGHKNKKCLDQPWLPPMPDDKVFSAIDQAFEEVERGGGNVKSPKDTMPVVANHVTAQGKEHDWRTPNNMFWYYQEALRRRGDQQ